MLLSTYQKKTTWKRGRCDRCNRFRWLCQHHIDRRSTDRIVWICSNGSPAQVLYTDSCHDFIHMHPEEAKKEGYYNEIDGEYRPKKSKPSKWKLKKKIGY